MWAVARVRISKRRISMQGKIYSFSSMSVSQSSNIRNLLRFKLTHFHFSVVLRIGCLMLWDDHFSVKSWSVPLPSSITMISIANQFNSYKDNHKNGKYSNTTLKVYLMYCRIDLVLWICIDKSFFNSAKIWQPMLCWFICFVQIANIKSLLFWFDLQHWENILPLQLVRGI